MLGVHDRPAWSIGEGWTGLRDGHLDSFEQGWDKVEHWGIKLHSLNSSPKKACHSLGMVSSHMLSQVLGS